MKKFKKKLFVALGLLLLFALWTMLIVTVDVQAVGPRGSSVGLATLNQLIHRWTGVNMSLYVLTDWLSLLPLGMMTGFAVLGLTQWVKRKDIRRVDRSILVLGGFYLLVLAAYAFFELFVINYRPVLIDGVLEASYPSSTTVLVLCVVPTGMMQLHSRLKNRKLRCCVNTLLSVFSFFMVLCRLFSGVHWFTDIIGGILLSSALVVLYSAVSGMKEK